MDSLVSISVINRLSCNHCHNDSETHTSLFEIILNIPPDVVSPVASQVSPVASSGPLAVPSETVVGPLAVPSETVVAAMSSTADDVSSLIKPAAIGGSGTVENGGTVELTVGGSEYVEFSLDEALAFMNGDSSAPPPPPPRRRAVTLHECFGSFSTPELIPNYSCSTCNPIQRPAEQQHRIGRGSEIFTVVLKRFEYGNPLKISIPVEIPMELDLATLPQSTAVGNYRLVGIVNHHGPSMHVGHYTAQVNIGSQWFKGDDSSFTHSVGFGTGSFTSSEAYVLIYERFDDGLAAPSMAAEQSVVATEQNSSSSASSDPAISLGSTDLVTRAA
jgi:hypothetical protein